MTAKKKVVTKKATAKKTERPTRGTSRAKDTRPARKRSIGNFRDMMSVENKDPEFEYRWILGATENDKRVVFALRAGWSFVDATVEKDMVVGDYSVAKSDRLGSIYRLPAARHGREEYLYLMRIPKDLADEIAEWKQSEIDESERALTEKRHAEDNEHGQYGGTEVTTELRQAAPRPGLR